MNQGYVLAHVLEAVVPGRDLGEAPTCEISIGESAAQCPIPSTLQNENVSLATGGNPEPVLHVRAFDSQQRFAGVVVVPISTLMSLEVWNVWYAMDLGGADNEESAPEDTPKMHLLLQYMSPAVACEESVQVREMRSQDFLLRALQQLNASLEAKVSARQADDAGALSVASLVEQACGDFDSSVASASTAVTSGDGSCVASGVVGTVSAQNLIASALSTARSSLSATSTSGNTGAGVLSSSGSMSAPPSRRWACSRDGAGTAMSTLASTTTGEAACNSLAGAACPALGHGVGPDASVVSVEGAGVPALKAAEACAGPHFEDLVRSRVEPYERALAALEAAKQKALAEQEVRAAALTEPLTKSLDDQRQVCHSLQLRLHDSDRRRMADLEAEQECTRQALAARATVEQKVVELQQEMSLRRAHEDALQKRITLMESELALAHQKCVLVDSITEEASSARRDFEAQRERRQELQDQFEEQGRRLARVQAEAWQAREEHLRELRKEREDAASGQRQVEAARLELQAADDHTRDKAAEVELLQQRMENLRQRATTLETEVSSTQAMLERERRHRQELERRVEEQGLGRAESLLLEHGKTISGLRDELLKVRKELQDARDHAEAWETQHASVQRELVNERLHVEEMSRRSGSQDQEQEEARRLGEHGEALRAQVERLQQDTRKMLDQHEQELGERSKSELLLCNEKEQQQREVCELRADLTLERQRAEELRLRLEQAERALACGKEAIGRFGDLQEKVRAAQDEAQGASGCRDALLGELTELRARTSSLEQQKAVVEGQLEDRSSEIKLLMYRVQELSSKYIAVRGDQVDQVLARWVNGYKPAVPFFRLAQGLYLFGRRQVVCKISNDKPVFRVGGGFIGFDKFLELYASEELERLLSYDMNDRTGEPNFVEAQKIRQAMEDTGAVQDLRERAEMLQSARAGVRDGGISGSSTRDASLLSARAGIREGVGGGSSARDTSRDVPVDSGATGRSAVCGYGGGRGGAGASDRRRSP